MSVTLENCLLDMTLLIVPRLKFLDHFLVHIAVCLHLTFFAGSKRLTLLKNGNFWKGTLWGTTSDFFHFMEKSCSIIAMFHFSYTLKTILSTSKVVTSCWVFAQPGFPNVQLWRHDEYLHNLAFQVYNYIKQHTYIIHFPICAHTQAFPLTCVAHVHSRAYSRK